MKFLVVVAALLAGSAAAFAPSTSEVCHVHFFSRVLGFDTPIRPFHPPGDSPHGRAWAFVILASDIHSTRSLDLYSRGHVEIHTAA